MAKDSWKRCRQCNRKQSSRRVENFCGPCLANEQKKIRKGKTED